LDIYTDGTKKTNSLKNISSAAKRIRYRSFSKSWDYRNKGILEQRL
jgi:hypothetical protein